MYSQFCLLKAKVTPSRRIPQKDYIVWIIVTKHKVEMTGGETISAHFQCTAGLMGCLTILVVCCKVYEHPYPRDCLIQNVIYLN